MLLYNAQYNGYGDEMLIFFFRVLHETKKERKKGSAFGHAVTKPARVRGLGSS